MGRRQRIKAVWILTGVALLATAVVVPLLVFAGSGQATLTAESYADVIRFEVRDAASLQITVYDLSEKELWDSGVVSGDWVDWDRTDTWGERLANGYYLYLAQAWDINDGLILSKTGKVALLPGDQAQLQAAPAVRDPGVIPSAVDNTKPTLQPMGLGDTGVFNLVGIGTASPASRLHIYASWPEVRLQDSGTGTSQMSFYSGGSLGGFFQYRGDTNLFRFGNYKAGGDVRLLSGGNNERMTITGAGNVGIGTTSPTKKLDVVGDTAVSGTLGVGTSNATARLTVQGTSGDLIAAYNGSARVFVIKSDGEVRADGAVYAASFNTGSADVAERINVSEWVEAGDVVEIDPDHPGFFRKSSDPYSRRVAGIISTSPGVILGNSTDSETGDWDDNRPVLAITGRVPVRVTTENGPIQVGDLLVASSTPGVAMRGNLAAAVGCVVGKAMEPLAEGDGEIVAQVMLR